jgi:hypothetical protein
MALLTTDTVLGPGADHAFHAVLVAFLAVVRHVAGAAFVGLLFALVVEGPTAVLQVVLGLRFGAVFGGGDDVTVLIDETGFFVGTADDIADVILTVSGW